jgi:hypothetical protein
MKKITSFKQDALINNLVDDFQKGENNLSSLREEWEEKEAILLGKTIDKETQTSKSKVFDPKLSTYLFERAARVMAQNPTGKVQAFTKKDKGKNIMLNILLKDYVIPNATSQFDFLTKTRLLDLYSNVYGSFAVQVDWVIRDDYVGPDFYLIPIRNIIFQPGVQNFEDSDYVFVRSYVSKSWLESRDKKVWKNIDKLLEGQPSSTKQYMSYVEEKYEQNTKNDMYEIITKFEKDRWITFSKDKKLILRDIANPQKNEKLPVVMKHCFPLLDRIIGLGEIERLKTLQYSINSLINLYLDGAKMSIFPPLMINPSLVVLRTLQYGAGQKWLVKGQGAVQQLPLSPLGLNTFTQTYSFLNAAILNAMGTTDTTVSKETDPGMGKTPRALAMMQMRESARDNWDRFMLERALEKILDRFVDLLTKRQEKPIKVYISKQDIDAISQINPDVVEMFESGKYGQLIIKPDETKNVNARFFIDAGSTLKKDEMIENETLTTILGFVFKIPGAMEQIAQGGKVRLGDVSINFGELFKRWIITSGTQDWDKIVSEEETAEPVNVEQNPDIQQVISSAPDEIKNLLSQIGYGQQTQSAIGQPNPASQGGFQETPGGETCFGGREVAAGGGSSAIL